MTRLEELAFQLADRAARSDVECCATCESALWARHRWNVNHPREDEDAEVLADAVEYLTLRGDALPFRMRREGNIVTFEARADG